MAVRRTTYSLLCLRLSGTAMALEIALFDDERRTPRHREADFPELTTFGADRAAALAHAVDGFEKAIASRIHARIADSGAKEPLIPI